MKWLQDKSFPFVLPWRRRMRSWRWQQVQVIPYSNHEAAQRTKVYDPPSSPPHPALPVPAPPPPPLSLRETSLSLSINYLFFCCNRGSIKLSAEYHIRMIRIGIQSVFSAIFMMPYQPPMSTLSSWESQQNCGLVMPAIKCPHKLFLQLLKKVLWSLPRQAWDRE